jgi:hypothetical protein
MQEMQKKETVKQSCSNKVASLAPSAFAVAQAVHKVLGPFREIPGTLPPRSSILPGGQNGVPEGCLGAPRHFSGRLNNPA